MREALEIRYRYNLPGASCAQLSPADADRLFFPDRHTPVETVKMCGGCPVQEQCLAVSGDEEYGVWGGVRRYPREDRHAA